MAKGPAVVALAGKSPLFPVTFYHERLRGAARKAAGSPWGMVLQIHPEVKPGAGDRETQIQSMIQRCADTLATEIADRKSTRLNSSHVAISYAVFCLKKNRT